MVAFVAMLVARLVSSLAGTLTHHAGLPVRRALGMGCIVTAMGGPRGWQVTCPVRPASHFWSSLSSCGSGNGSHDAPHAYNQHSSAKWDSGVIFPEVNDDVLAFTLH